MSREGYKPAKDDLGFPAFRAARELISVVSRHPVYSNLLKEPQEANTFGFLKMLLLVS